MKRCYITILTAGIVLSGMVMMSRGIELGQNVTDWQTSVEREIRNADLMKGIHSVTIKFPARSPMALPAAALVTAGSKDAGANPFVGDFSDVKTAVFTIVSDGSVPDAATGLWLYHAESGWWYNRNVSVPAEAGVAVVNTVSLRSVTDGWGTEEKAEKFAKALQNVEMIGVRLRQGGFDEEVYAVKDFKLTGDEERMTQVAELTRVESGLWEAFHALETEALDEEKKAVDTDGDGMTDVKEILAGTDRKSADSVFAAQMAAAASDGVAILWPCVEDGRYQVLRTADLSKPFEVVSGSEGLMPSKDEVAAGVMRFVDQSIGENNHFYYKVKLIQ